MYNELYESLLKKKLKQVNNKIESLNDQIKLIERENSILGITIEQPLIENKIYNPCEIYKVKINDLTKALQGLIINDLTLALQGLTNSKQRPKNILENQKSFQNKKGLGFEPQKQRKSNKRYLASKTKKYLDDINCFYCNQRSHYIKKCLYRKGTYTLKPNEKLI